MQPNDFQCPDCGKSVPTMNRVFHEATCRGRHTPRDDQPPERLQKDDLSQRFGSANGSDQSGSRAMTFGQPLNPPSQPQEASIFQNQQPQENDWAFRGMFAKPKSPEAYPKVDTKYKREELPVDPRYQMGYTCPKCTAFVPEKQFKGHVEKCQYSACPFCYDYYPNEFINEHRHFCERNPANTQGARPDFHMDMESPGGTVQGRSPVPMQTPPNATPQPQAPRTPVQSQASDSEQEYSPFGGHFGRPSDGSNSDRPGGRNLADLYMSPSRSVRSEPENPFLVFFRGHAGAWGQPASPAPPRQQVYRRVFINGREVDPDRLGAPGDEDDFFQLFMNHGNFMRQNRLIILGPRLIELLEQLSNPNRGVPREQLNRIEKKIFRKGTDVKAGEEEKCPICITEFEDGEEVKNLPCNHMFHGNCIDTWLVQNSHCPICKADLLQH